jgi:hypothetical protein
MAQRREHFLEEKRNEAEQKALMLQVEIADLKTKIEKLEWHNADLQKRNDGQAQDLKERDDEMLKDVLFAELKSNVAFYKAESEKRGNVIEKILAEESKKSEGGWLFFPTEDGIRVKFPEPTQTMHIPTAHMKELIALLIKFIEKEVEKQKWGPLSGD